MRLTVRIWICRRVNRQVEWIDSEHRGSHKSTISKGVETRTWSPRLSKFGFGGKNVLVDAAEAGSRGRNRFRNGFNSGESHRR